MQNKKIKNLNFAVNDLILFCIYSISLGNEKCSFERLVKEGGKKAAEIARTLKQGKLL